MVVDLDDSDDDGDAAAGDGWRAGVRGRRQRHQPAQPHVRELGAPASAGGASGMGGGAAAGPSATHQAELARVQEQARKHERELAALAQRGGSLLRPGEVSGRVDKEPARKRVRWSEAEEAALKDGVQRSASATGRSARTSAASTPSGGNGLKDKWTNLKKRGDV